MMPSASQFVLTGTRGAADRSLILVLLAEQPRTLKQLADATGRDCATVRSHLDVLQKNDLVDARGDTRTHYRPTSRARADWETVEKAAEKVHGEQTNAPNLQRP